MDVNLISQGLGIIAAAIGALLLIIYKNQDSRLKEQEARLTKMESEVSNHAEKQREVIRRDQAEFRVEVRALFDTTARETSVKREEARHDLTNFRSELSTRVETVRVETNARLDSTNVKIDGIVNQIGALALLQIRENGKN